MYLRDGVRLAMCFQGGLRPCSSGVSLLLILSGEGVVRLYRLVCLDVTVECLSSSAVGG